MKKIFLVLFCFIAVSCQKQEPKIMVKFNVPNEGLIIIDEAGHDRIEVNNALCKEEVVLLTNYIVNSVKGRNAMIIENLGVFYLSEGVSFNFSDIQKLTLTLHRGKIASYIQKLTKEQSLDIYTPTAVVGVRGTTFSIEHLNGKTSLSMKSGCIEITTEKTNAIIEAGLKGTVVPGGKLKVVKLSLSEIKAWKDLSDRDMQISALVFSLPKEFFEDSSINTNQLKVKSKIVKIKERTTVTLTNNPKFIREGDGQIIPPPKEGDLDRHYLKGEGWE